MIVIYQKGSQSLLKPLEKRSQRCLLTTGVQMDVVVLGHTRRSGMKKIILEGYYDTDSGWEFEMPVVLMSPTVELYHANSVGCINNFIEDFIIDLDFFGLHGGQQDCLDDYLDASNSYDLAKKGHETLKYWMAEVEYDENTINVVKKEGW